MNWDTRPGYINGKKILGYTEVTLRHIAGLAEDLWGGHRPGTAPAYQRRTSRPGKWRKCKNLRLYGEEHWYMRRHTETGCKILTAHYHRRAEEDDYRW